MSGRTSVSNYDKQFRSRDEILLEDNINEFDIVDTRKYVTLDNNYTEQCDDIPESIKGIYSQDYNISHIDTIIKKKLYQEKFSYLNKLILKYKSLEEQSKNPQTYLNRETTLDMMKNISDEILQIQTGEKLKNYNNRVKNILEEYHKYDGIVKTIVFDINDQNIDFNDDHKRRIYLIDKYLEIAGEYLSIDIIRVDNKQSDLCNGCGMSLAKVAPSDEGTIRCPYPECQTEHNAIIMMKLAKDGSRIIMNNNTEDESIDNFLRAFMRYQGLQQDKPDPNLYIELDNYFKLHERPTGSEISVLPLNEHGRRGDTNHKMLWDALSHIGRSEYYEDTNLIGHIYWGWVLPNLMNYKELIISHYNKTQKVFYQIPPDERGRNSSLGTQYRLWRHLQLVGHLCHMDEFKIAMNQESLRCHNKLWKLMCEGAGDPDIYYIP